MTTEAEFLVSSIINNAISLANGYANASSEVANVAIAASEGYAEVESDKISYAIRAAEPKSPDADDAELTYESHRDQLIELLS